MSSNLFELSGQDFFKGAVTSVLGASFIAVLAIFSQVGFDLFNTDWKMVANIAFIAGSGGLSGYLIKNFFSSSTAKTETTLGVKLDK